MKYRKLFFCLFRISIFAKSRSIFCGQITQVWSFLCLWTSQRKSLEVSPNCLKLFSIVNDKRKCLKIQWPTQKEITCHGVQMFFLHECHFVSTIKQCYTIAQMDRMIIFTWFSVNFMSSLRLDWRLVLSSISFFL